MNPSRLFTLTPAQKELFRIQPDRYEPGMRQMVTEEFELPSFVDKTCLRLWYNTQMDGYAKHWHDALEIVIPLENEYAVSLQEEEYRLEPGDILLIPPGELHTLQPPPPGSRFIFLLDLDLFCQMKSFLQTRSLLTKPVLLSAGTFPEIYERVITLFMEIASLYWGDSPSRQLSIYARMLDFFACFTDFHISGGPTASPGVFRSADSLSKKLNHFLEYLQVHYAEELPLEEAAERIGVSKYYFTRIFRRHTGQTFNDYLTSLRVRAAEDLLKNGGVSVSEICARCGYTSMSSFNRNFRRLKGCSPTEFRQFYQRR